MVVKPSKHPGWRIHTPQRSRCTDLYRLIKCRLGHTLKSQLQRGFMVLSRKTTTHKRARIKSSNPSNTTYLKTVHSETGTSSLRQHHCCSPHKQARRNPLNQTLRPHVETPYLMQQTPNNNQSETRPRFT